ncbi:MAG: hypothetical protein HUU55_04095 [Myxococcales bacterium]|nr:hypothetical protein [Myxococcales bacterium]
MDHFGASENESPLSGYFVNSDCCEKRVHEVLQPLEKGSRGSPQGDHRGIDRVAEMPARRSSGD